MLLKFIVTESVKISYSHNLLSIFYSIIMKVQRIASYAVAIGAVSKEGCIITAFGLYVT